MEEANLTNKLVVMGGSAGSLAALLKIFAQVGQWQLPPIVLVLHRSPLQDDTILVDLLAARTGLLVKEAEEKEVLQPSHLYVAPADYHLLFESGHTFSLDASEKINFSRPSIDVSLESAADVYGKALTAILLSGANSDGAMGLERVIAMQGKAIIQAPSTADVAYMPQNAIAQGLNAQIMTPEEIGFFLSAL